MIVSYRDKRTRDLAAGKRVKALSGIERPAHLKLDPAAELGAVLTVAREALHSDFAIDHATLQVEPAGAGRHCTPTGW